MSEQIERGERSSEFSAAGGTLSALVGVLTLRLTVDGTFERYVKGGMRPWLLAAGVLLVVLGAVTLWRSVRGEHRHADHDDPADHADHEHEEHRVGIGWLLLAPVATLLLVAPPPLGSFGVDRGAPVQVTSGHGEFKPLPRSGSPVSMTLTEYTQRSFDAHGRSLAGGTVALTGFVADGSTSSMFRLARYQISCCAADASASVVDVVGFADSPPHRDQWVTVTGHFQQGTGDEPTLAATQIEPISAPEDPYE